MDIFEAVLPGPTFAAKAEGAYFWDPDGNRYLDFLMGFGPIVLGYNDPVVNAAVRAQVEHGTIYSVANPLEVETSKRLIGAGPMPSPFFPDEDERPVIYEKALPYCLAHGVYLHTCHPMFLTLSHTFEDIERVIAIWDGALKAAKG